MRARIAAIAANTFREAIRDRVLYNLIVFVLILVAAAVLFGQISIGINRLVVISLSLSSISVFGVLIAIFIGIGLVSKEIEKKTLYTVLARPVRRWEFILGKFAGLVETLVVNTFLMTGAFYLALLYVSHHFTRSDLNPLVAIYLIVLELIVMTALALLFSSFSTPVLSAVLAFAVFVIGTYSEDLRGFAAMSHGLTKALATGAAYLIPNLGSLNVISIVAHDQPVSGSLIIADTVYAALYATAVLAASMLIFERRNLK
jgi:ABC-type transport system involved in multi-copper enzyme maturation permease subunit